MASIPDEQFLVDADGKRKGVLLSMERYEQLTEDLHDLAVVAERREEEPISFDVTMLRLKKMALFSIDFKPSAEKDLHHLPRDIVLRAMEKIEDLNQTHFPANPSGYPAPKGFIVYELETTDHLRS